MEIYLKDKIEEVDIFNNNMTKLNASEDIQAASFEAHLKHRGLISQRTYYCISCRQAVQNDLINYVRMQFNKNIISWLK